MLLCLIFKYSKTLGCIKEILLNQDTPLTFDAAVTSPLLNDPLPPSPRCEWSTACEVDLCRNGGQCQGRWSTRGYCECGEGFSGDKCQKGFKPIYHVINI